MPTVTNKTTKLHLNIKTTNPKHTAVFPICMEPTEISPSFVTKSKIHRLIYPNRPSHPKFRRAPSNQEILSWKLVHVRAKQHSEDGSSDNQSVKVKMAVHHREILAT